jgi:hypothetical protein
MSSKAGPSSVKKSKSTSAKKVPVVEAAPSKLSNETIESEDDLESRDDGDASSSSEEDPDSEEDLENVQPKQKSSTQVNGTRQAGSAWP